MFLRRVSWRWYVKSGLVAVHISAESIANAQGLDETRLERKLWGTTPNELLSAFIDDLAAIAMLWPRDAKEKIMDLHVKWRDKYYNWWFKKWHRKYKRKL